MTRELTIETDVPTNRGSPGGPERRRRLRVKLQGGSPWFGYIWIEGQLFTISVSGVRGTITVKRTRISKAYF